MPAFLRTFVDSELIVPSGSEVKPDGSGFQPLLFDKEQVKMVGCFTDRKRIGDFSKMTPYFLAIIGKEFLRRMPPGYGLVINPGLSIGFDISPAGVSRIVGGFA